MNLCIPITLNLLGPTCHVKIKEPESGIRLRWLVLTTYLFWVLLKSWNYDNDYTVSFFNKLNFKYKMKYLRTVLINTLWAYAINAQFKMLTEFWVYHVHIDYFFLEICEIVQNRI